MGRNEDLSAEDVRLDALVKSEYEKHVAAKKYIEEAEEIIRHAEENVEDFPDDEEDQRRRFLEIMKEMRAQGQLTEEEEAQLFGDEADKTDENTDCGTEEISATSDEAAEEVASENRKERKYRGARKNNTTHKVVGIPRKRLFGRTVGKWTAIIALTCIGVFTVTMSSQANRQYFSDTVSYLLGRDTRVSVNNDDGALIRGMTEDEARMDISEKLGVSVPTLKYKPHYFEFVGYECYAEYKYALVHYKFQKNEIILYIAEESDKKTRSELFDGRAIGQIILKKNIAKADFYENCDGDDEPTYGAEWNYDDAYYSFLGKMPKEEFEKVLEKIWY